MGAIHGRTNHTGGKVGKLGTGKKSSIVTAEIFEEICTRMEEGRSLVSVCNDEDMPYRRDVNRYINEVEGASDRYARACAERAEFMAELAIVEAYNQSTDNGAVARDRLKVDTIKWFTAKIHPKKFGDRIQTEDITERPRTLVIMSPKHGE